MESSSITALKLLMAVGFNKRTATTYHHIASLCARPSCFTAPCCIRRELVVCIPSAGDFVSHDVPTVSFFLMARGVVAKIDGAGERSPAILNS
jgi:hypothetical protein